LITSACRDGVDRSVNAMLVDHCYDVACKQETGGSTQGDAPPAGYEVHMDQ
jgi:hypothetical protein